MDIQKIGFIGTGVMGSPMARHLMDAGFSLNIYTRTKERAQDLIDAGATWCDTPAQCAKDCDVVISIVGYPKDVEEVWLGQHGALAAMKPHSIAMDMTTSSPELAKELANKAKEYQVSMADCPVTGGDIGARNATLTMLFGGDTQTFEDLTPVFKALGKKYVYFGLAGKGQIAKACNQIAIASTMFSVCEAIKFASSLGLDPHVVIETIGGGAAGSFSMSSYGPRILKGDYEPGFKIEHFIKDIEIAIKVCEDHGISLPGLDLARRTYQMLVEMGYGAKGTQALYMLYSSPKISGNSCTL